MKKLLAPLGIIIAAIILGGGVYLAVRHFSGNYLASDSATKVHPVVSCTGQHDSHTVTIKNNNMNPVDVQGALCDTLTITNADDITREMAFGPHEHHVAYDGVTEKTLTKDQSLTVTLDQAGTYLFHDHLHDELAGEVIVK
jgi:plastocyanin